MNPPILLKRRERLSRELVSWQIATAGILVLSVACNMAMAAHIGQMEDQYREAIAGYEVRIDHMENIRDMAVQQLGAAVLQNQRDAKARAEQAAAYETIGCISTSENAPSRPIAPVWSAAASGPTA